MKVVYNKKHEFKLFGIKLFELKTQYCERSNDKDDEFNDELIVLNQKILEENL